jgi:hypothetical protein
VIYPEHQDIWKYDPYQTDWKDVKNQRAFFDNLATKLNIQRPQDWNRISTKRVVKEGGYFMKYYYRGSLTQSMDIIEIVSEIYT